MSTLSGKSGSFTTGTGSQISLADFEGFEWHGEFDARVEESTPFGWYGVRRSFGLLDARGTLSHFVSPSGGASPSGFPTIPTGVAGTLVLLTESGQSKTFKAIIHALDLAPNSLRATQQVAMYQFAMSTQTSTATPIT